MNRTTRATSLPLIIVTLIAGVALGWWLNDQTQTRASQGEPAAATDAAPSPTPQPIAAATDAPLPPTPEPTRAASPTPSPTAPPSPTPSPTAPPIVGYIGHTVAQGETLDSIARQAGSTPALIAQFNRLNSEPPAGRPLIVPQLEGQPSTIASEPLLVQKGRSDRPLVALTLDAGASAEPVPSILQTLRERHIKITFFLTGAWIKQNPELARQIVADGHEIGNHSFNHPDLTKVSDAVLRKELGDTEDLLQSTAGATSRPLFRPPYGAYDEQVLLQAESQGFLPIYWTIDSLDSVGETKTPAFLMERITRKLTPAQLRGAIILAHCGSQPTADALPQILDRFAEMGLQVTTVSQVLGG